MYKNLEKIKDFQEPYKKRRKSIGKYDKEKARNKLLFESLQATSMKSKLKEFTIQLSLMHENKYTENIQQLIFVPN